MLPRYYNLANIKQKNKVLVVYGPRRVGKTTLLNDFLAKTELKYKIDSGDNIKTQEILASQDFSKILAYAEGYELITIDEAQNIPNIGMALKILVDQIPGIYVVVTGSSSFDLEQKIGEPLTGRKKTLILYPFSQIELLNVYNKQELQEKLTEFLIFGSYPEVFLAKTKKEKIAILNELVSSYLLKDVLNIEKIRGSFQLLNLLKLLAFQVGNEVSLSELATQIKMDVKTVAKYLDILEKGFVIKRMGGFSRNLRQEITTKAKYYFLDNGIRNAVISQFNDLNDRDDVGRLFENFVVMEKIKKDEYKESYGNLYFWRTYAGQEIDLIEDKDGQLRAFEIKWSQNFKKDAPKDWKKTYSESEYKVINRENYLEFLV